VPLSNRAGKPVKAEGPALLVADFEDGSITHKLSGNWESEFDQNKIGTTLNPSPLKLTPGGYKGSKNCLRFWGHFGKSGAPPWPYADIGAGRLLSTGIEALAIKRGSRGATIYRPQKPPVDVPSFPVDVLNVLGAGDAFASGFIYGCLQGWPLERAVRMGNACGAIVVTRRGCANFMPTLTEIDEFVAAKGGWEWAPQHA